MVSSNIARRDYFSDLLTVIQLALLSMLGYQIYLCLQKYLSEPTHFETKNLHQFSAKFPDITVCNNVNGGMKNGILEVLKVLLKNKYKSWAFTLKNSLLQAHGTNIPCYQILDQTDLGKQGCVNWKSNQSKTLELFDMASFKLSDMAQQIIVKTRKDNKQWLLLTNDKINSSLVDTKEQRSPNDGKCYTIRFKKIIRANNIASIKFM